MKKYTLLIIAVIVLAGGSYFTEHSFLASSAPVSTDTIASTTGAAVRGAPAQQALPARVQQSPETAAQAANVTLLVPGTSYGVYVRPGATVVDAMNTLISTTNFRFTAKDFPGMGMFVESINGKQNGDGSYWFLYVNGKSSDTGVSQTTLKAGDTIEWRYEKSY
ncbi:DUF4430 domain-containing protein [Candidatus Kaiserbacteria bacterium]|nr:DUF4430 domain-containing protein [Candidatus Kaiserbacteria bacterium]